MAGTSLFALIDIQDAAENFNDQYSSDLSKNASETLNVIKSAACNDNKDHARHLTDMAHLVQNAVHQEQHDPAICAQRFQTSGFSVLLPRVIHELHADAIASTNQNANFSTEGIPVQREEALLRALEQTYNEAFPGPARGNKKQSQTVLVFGNGNHLQGFLNTSNSTAIDSYNVVDSHNYTEVTSRLDLEGQCSPHGYMIDAWDEFNEQEYGDAHNYIGDTSRLEERCFSHGYMTNAPELFDRDDYFAASDSFNGVDSHSSIEVAFLRGEPSPSHDYMNNAAEGFDEQNPLVPACLLASSHEDSCTPAYDSVTNRPLPLVPIHASSTRPTLTLGHTLFPVSATPSLTRSCGSSSDSESLHSFGASDMLSIDASQVDAYQPQRIEVESTKSASPLSSTRNPASTSEDPRTPAYDSMDKPLPLVPTHALTTRPTLIPEQTLFRASSTSGSISSHVSSSDSESFGTSKMLTIDASQADAPSTPSLAPIPEKPEWIEVQLTRSAASPHSVGDSVPKICLGDPLPDETTNRRNMSSLLSMKQTFCRWLAGQGCPATVCKGPSPRKRGRLWNACDTRRARA